LRKVLQVVSCVRFNQNNGLNQIIIEQLILFFAAVVFIFVVVFVVVVVSRVKEALLE
jgi:hypothetical protein